MASSSAVLRRWISISGILRSRRISVSFCSCESDANRMMSTATSDGGVSSSEPPSAPWLMLPPAVDESGNIAYKFHSLAKKEEFTHTIKIGGGGGELQLPVDINMINDVVFAGSSHGWLALYNRRNCDLFLSNPITDRHIKLPPLPTSGAAAADRVILSSSLSPDNDDDERLALMTFGSRRRLAFCSPRRSKEWTLLGGEDRAYDNLVYSSRHKRLFCVCEEEEDYSGDKSVRLECWDVHHQPPKLDWVNQFGEEDPVDFGFLRFVQPASASELRQECFRMRYLVCAEHSGELYLVVRHVNPRAGPMGSIVNKVMLSRYRGCHYIRTPYKTIDFDVYKVDPERGAVMYMEDWSEGLAVFIGINHPFAIPAAGVAGLKPDCIYFTDENRVVEPTRLERTSYGGHDNGIFDHQTKAFSACSDFYPIEFETIRKILPLPLWFTPTAII